MCFKHHFASIKTKSSKIFKNLAQSGKVSFEQSLVSLFIYWKSWILVLFYQLVEYEKPQQDCPGQSKVNVEIFEKSAR